MKTVDWSVETLRHEQKRFKVAPYSFMTAREHGY